MKVLFFAAHYAYYRNFESAIVALAERGHRVHLAADEPESLGGEALVERLAARYPGVTFGFAPSLDNEPWFCLARKLRSASDYVRFHDAAFATFRKTRLTLRERIPRGVLWLMDAGLDKSRVARRVVGSALRASEAAMPISEASRAFIEAHDPDVVLMASVTAWRLPQIDHLRAARALGCRTGICVFSWDHLSSKALLRTVPDRVLLWNETQKEEAVRWHGMPEERMTVTGAQCYDQWFDRRPSRDRVSFCRAVGLSPDHPILLYVCSVMTPNPYESRFVQRWIEEIRRSADPRLRNAGILVRPHPERMDEWEGVSLERFGNAVLYGRNPVSPDAQDDYFDSLYHSHAVIGLVTSAFLEAAIVGRPVHTLLLPEFEMYQEGVQHFRYLLEVEGGLLKVTRTFPDHLNELAAVVASGLSVASDLGRKLHERDEQNVRFVRAFVRPGGLDVPATPAFVQAVEQLASSDPLPAEIPGAWHRALQPLVRVVAQSSEHGWLRAALRDTPETINDRSKARKAAQKEAAAAEREQRVAAKRQFLAARRRERRRQQWVGARRKQLGRLIGRVKALIGSRSVMTIPAPPRTLAVADEVRARVAAPAGAATAPLVGIGVTLRNRAAFLTEAIDSLLAQSYENFRLVLVDDGSTDGTEAIARAYEQRDRRVRYIRFAERRGMVAAWRTAFEYASADEATYFAWGSDHDRWHPRWLATLVETLEQHPDVVLAYPLTQRIDAAGTPLAKPARQFETFGVPDLAARWARLSRSDAVAAGDIVYGLMRADAVRDAGVFRDVLCPDRLLVAELTLRGQIRQVPKVLWYRRQFAAGSIERQRSSLFEPGAKPPSAFTPPWYMHARLLWATYGRPAHAPLGLPRSTTVRFIAQYAAAYAWRHYAKSSVQRGILTVLGWPRWIYKRVKHGFLLGVHGTLVALRQVGVTPRIERLCERVTGRPGAVRMRTAQPALAVASHSDATLAGTRVKVLFIARHFTYFRNYESVIAALVERGHRIHLAAEREEDLGGHAMVERLAAYHPGLSFGWIPDRQDLWAPFVTKLRMTIDYLRYLDPAYASTPKLRARAKERVPRIGLWLVALGGAGTRLGRRIVRAALCACERAVPRSRQIDAYLSDQRPDVVLFTPLIGVVASPQLDYLQSAKALGYATALCVWSWDHLSSKAILRNIPDRLFVWNETQRQEAVTMHGVPPERVVVTGAQCFDQWFNRTPSTDHATFCSRIGLPDRPFLLYVCSALFQGSASEALFVRRWIRELRASGLEPLASTSILARPHPARLKEWMEVDLSAEPDVAVWGRNPVDPDARADYFDSLYYSAAIVGLNTSAFLEGAVVGRPVFAPLLPEHHENQEGTIHFHYLLNVGGGLLHTSRTLREHVAQLNDVLANQVRLSASAQASADKKPDTTYVEPESPRSRRFVEAFIRPHGIGVAATPVFVSEVEALAALTREPVSEPGRIGMLRLALTPVAALVATGAAAPLVSSEHERAIAVSHRAHRARVAQAWRVKDAHNAAEQSAKDARLAERQRYKAQRAAEWRRTKTMKKLKQRIKKRIGLAS